MSCVLLWQFTIFGFAGTLYIVFKKAVKPIKGIVKKILFKVPCRSSVELRDRLVTN